MNISLTYHLLEKQSENAIMEHIENKSILNFNANTLHDVRKELNLDDKKHLDESIDILEAWLQKQDYFVKKSYPRNYLERLLIFNKGSVEKAKSKLEKLCALRTLLPHFFDNNDIDGRRMLPDVIDGLMPQMTLSHERIYVLKNCGKKFDSGLLNYYKYIIFLAEYIQVHDYNNGIIVLIDYRNADIYELMKALNLVEMKQVVTIITQGYSMRVKQLHIISNNKSIEILIKLFKQVFSDKIVGRLMLHKTIDTIYEYIPKNVLPKEYGDLNVTMDNIFDLNFKEITSEPFMKHLQERSQAKVTEDYKNKNQFDPEVMGVAGTFRAVNID